MTDDNLARLQRTIASIVETMETLGVIDPNDPPNLLSDPFNTPSQQAISRNPEDHVLDEIDKLVDEQLRGGPIDDYSADYYPKCQNCGHDWHGIRCAHCNCPTTEVEVTGTAENPVIYPRYRLSAGHPYIEDRVMPYVDQIESVRITDDRDPDNRRVYTLADLARMQAEIDASRRPQAQVRLWDHNMVYLGDVEWPVRFYGVLADPDNPEAIEGTLEIVAPAGPQWLDELIEHTQQYVLGTIAEIAGLPALPELDVHPRPINMLEAPSFDPEVWLADVERDERREIAHAVEVGTADEIAQCEQCWRAGAERTGCSCLEHDPED